MAVVIRICAPPVIVTFSNFGKFQISLVLFCSSVSCNTTTNKVFLYMQHINQPERAHQEEAQTDHCNYRVNKWSAHQAAAHP
jgi:hypothetical protein